MLKMIIYPAVFLDSASIIYYIILNISFCVKGAFLWPDLP